MPPLLSCRDLAHSYGSRPLFEGISLDVHEGERLGLIGPNGAGKSTLLKILAGIETPGAGSRVLRKRLLLRYVPQEEVFPADVSIRELIVRSLTELSLEDYEQAARLDRTLTRFEFPNPEAPAGTLSGGWRKRLALAIALAAEPELLLLDEPTNHLDLEGIVWLEKLLADASFACVVVSHDRFLLEHAMNRIVEISRRYPAGFFNAAGSYSEFLSRREDFLAGQLKQEASLAGKVRREIEWLRRGPPARTTKAAFRVNQAGRLQSELRDKRDRNSDKGAVGLDFAGTGRKANKLLVGKGLSKELGGRTLFRNLDLMLSPGVRVGLLGVNGSGKTTLLRILNGELAADAGVVERAPNLRTTVFDQNRAQLDRSATLKDALSPTGDNVLFNGRSMHVEAWARRFLFRSEQMNVQVSSLSGGEQARILLARLMTQPADVLLMDEPTNDLDIPSLEVLEESLLEFTGALVLVSHDRYLLERVSTVLLGINVDGDVTVCTDLDQWARARERVAAGTRADEPQQVEAGAVAAKPAAKSKKLSFVEQRELAQIEAKIQTSEAALEVVKAELASPAVVADRRKLDDCCRRMDVAQKAVDSLYARWQELEAKRDA